MLANAILDRTSIQSQPNSVTIKVIADYVYDNCDGNSLNNFLNMNGVNLALSPKKIIKNMLANNLVTFRHNQDFKNCLQNNVTNRFNIIQIIFGPTGKNFKLNLFSNILNILATYAIYRTSGSISINYIPYLIYVLSILLSCLLYGIFTKKNLLIVMIGSMIPLLVPTFNLILEYLVTHFDNVGGLLLTLIISIFKNSIIYMIKIIIVKKS